MGKFAMTDREPPATGIRFTVGRDAGGRWIVTDTLGKVGGLFTDRASAVHFAMFESDHTPGAVWCLPEHVVVSSARSSMAAGSARPAGSPAGREVKATVHPIRYLRGYVYPRGGASFPGSQHLRAADAVLGVATVLSAVLAVAYALTVLAEL